MHVMRTRAFPKKAIVLGATLLILAFLGSTYIAKGALPGPTLLVLAGLAVFALILKNRVVGLAILLGSYAYCLPVVYYRFLGEHPFRLYDMAVAAMVLAYLADIFMGKPLIVAKTSINRPLLYLVSFCLFSIIVVALDRGLLDVPRAGIRWVRLAGYALAFVFVCSSVTTSKQIRLLLNVLLAGAVVQGVLSSLQSLGLMGPLWDYQRLGGYGPEYYVGTMAPHHLHLRMYMVMALAVLVAKAKMCCSLRGKIGLAVCSGFLIYPLFNTHSRTGILVVGVYGATTLIFSRKRVQALVAAMIGGLVLFLVLGGAPFEVGQKEVQKQIDKMRTPTGYDPTRLSGGRMRIYGGYGDRLAKNPGILLWGMGYESGWGGAHNCYAHVFLELGLPGLLIWLWLLMRIWRRARRVAGRSPSPEARVLAREFLCLFAALLVANLTSEVLYPRRATYSYFGQFLFLSALVVHPLWL